jgi:trk system potassium uptake protein TrkH
MNIFKKMTVSGIIALGFAILIAVGSILMALPISVKEGVEFSVVDAIFTATSAVCVTGLSVIDPGSCLTTFGKVVLIILIQLGGLGMTLVGTGIIVLVRRKVDFKNITLVRNTLNLSNNNGVVPFLGGVFKVTAISEIIGAILSYFVFVRRMPATKAIGVSIFHSISAFNNAGFDIIGSGNSMIDYDDSLALKLITCGLIIIGGIGFLVIKDIKDNFRNPKRFSLHTKVVLSVTATLLIGGTIALYLIEDISLADAFFNSVTARTAGFAVNDLNKFSFSSMVLITILMFIGASPGGTGGGVKTSTIFVLFKGMIASATNKAESAFRYAINETSFRKAAIITLVGIHTSLLGIFLITIFDKDLDALKLVFEVFSAFGTVGLSMGVTSSLSAASKLLLTIIMYIGRIGPFTVLTLFRFSEVERVRYAEGDIAIG